MRTQSQKVAHEQGFSLLELVVSGFIFVLLLSSMMALTSSYAKQSRAYEEKLVLMREARLIHTALAQDISNALALLEVSENELDLLMGKEKGKFEHVVKYRVVDEMLWRVPSSGVDVVIAKGVTGFFGKCNKNDSFSFVFDLAAGELKDSVEFPIIYITSNLTEPLKAKKRRKGKKEKPEKKQKTKKHQNSQGNRKKGQK